MENPKKNKGTLQLELEVHRDVMGCFGFICLLSAPSEGIETMMETIHCWRLFRSTPLPCVTGIKRM